MKASWGIFLYDTFKWYHRSCKNVLSVDLWLMFSFFTLKHSLSCITMFITLLQFSYAYIRLYNVSNGTSIRALMIMQMVWFVCLLASTWSAIQMNAFHDWLPIMEALRSLYMYFIKCLEALLCLSGTGRNCGSSTCCFCYSVILSITRLIVDDSGGFIWMIQLLVGTGEEHQTLALLNMASRSCFACCLLYSWTLYKHECVLNHACFRELRSFH